MAEIEYKGAEQLAFDYSNPRMVEYNFSEEATEKQVINTFWDEMATEELVMSILAHGFFQHEPLYVIKDLRSDRYIVVEGNRRLAAVKSILNPNIIDNDKMEKFKAKITPAITQQLQTHIPVLILQDREDAWRYIGFKHVNGAAKWGSYAKAQYIATVKNSFGKSLSEIAEQIGDANNMVKKLYQGLILLDQADKKTDFNKNDSYAKHIYFSHLYTAISYENFRSYLGLNADFEDENPVPSAKLKNLEQVMFWLYGSSTKKIVPIIQSQNPDLRKLMEVLGNKEATEYLKLNNDLSIAFDVCKGGSTVLYEALIKAKIALEKAGSKIGDYDGSLETLRIAADIANAADNIFERMDSIRNPKPKIKAERVVE